MAMKRRKIRELKDEIERRDLVALERRAGTEIRVATIEREAITADYYKSHTNTHSKDRGYS